MELKQLLENVDVVSSIHNAEIHAICTESSQLTDNSSFLITGEGHHKIVPYSNNMLQVVILNRTGFILWDSENWPEHEDDSEPYRYIDATHYRKSCAQICSNFYGRPSESLLMIGVTGTNGKTSTSHIIERILEFSKLYRPLLIGTLNTRCCNAVIQPSYTTPYCDIIQKLLRSAADEYHANSAVMEISSRGLDQERVGGIMFDVSVYTNLTKDHLNYHATFDEYRQTKAILFENLTKSFAIINGDDNYAQNLIERTKKTVRVMTYGIVRSHDTDVYASNILISYHGLNFDIHIPATNSTEHIHIPCLIGKTNVYNSLAAIACAHLALKIPLEICRHALATMPSIPGRLEFVTVPHDPITVIIDSAHTPDGFKEILGTIRECTKHNNLICLFGCRGDADHANRPLKAAVASQLSDKVIITSDTSASEEPIQIVQDILVGFSSTSNRDGDIIIELDRRQAIRKAILSIMHKGDTLVILGKRHDVNRMLQNRMIDFDDRIVVRECIQEFIQNNTQ